MVSSPESSSPIVSDFHTGLSLLATLRRHRRLGTFIQDPHELEQLSFAGSASPPCEFFRGQPGFARPSAKFTNGSSPCRRPAAERAGAGERYGELIGLPYDRVAAVAPGLRSFTHAGRQVVFAEVVDSAAGPGSARTFGYLRRCLGHAIDYGYGQWAALRDVFTPAVAELVEALVPHLLTSPWAKAHQGLLGSLEPSPTSATASGPLCTGPAASGPPPEPVRAAQKALAQHLATTHLRRELGVSREVDRGFGALSAAAVLLLHDAHTSTTATARLLTRIALLPVGGDLCALALDGLREAGLVTADNRETLSPLLRRSSGRVRIAAARALGGPRAEATLAHALTVRRKQPDIPVRAAAALSELAPRHPMIPDALALLELGLEVPDVARLAQEALRQWRTRESADPLRD